MAGTKPMAKSLVTMHRHKKHHHAKPSLWLQYVNEFNNRVPVYNCQPAGTCDDFYYHTNGLLCCLDWHVRSHSAIGICAGGFDNSLTWCDCNGKAHNGTAQGGIYARYFPQHFFIDGLISGGGNWGSAHRNITFYGVARTAYSRPKNKNVELQVQGGLSYWQWLIPTARLSYFFNRQAHFQECNADSLNLAVHTYTTHTLHANIGLEMNHTFENNHIKFVPQLQLAWAGDFLLHSHTLKAQLCGPDGYFCVNGMHQPGGYFVCSAELNFILNNCGALFTRYEAQIRNKCAIHAFKVGFQTTF
jgi:uncharacterized protein with beta-barrel porin domain